MGEGAVSTYVLEQGLEGARGTVHSTFRSSMNVAVNGFLLHLGSTADPLSCLGIAVPRARMAELLGFSRRDDLVTFGEGFLRVYGLGGAMRVDYGDFEPWDAKIPRLGDGWSADVLSEVVCDRDVRAGIGLHPSRDLADALLDLSLAPEVPDGVARVMRAARFLVGRGLGLTPSGDDLLAGYGCALWARSREDLLEGFQADALPGRTTDVSVAYLRAMADGYANADFVSLVRSMNVRDVALCRDSTDTILGVGHTSGHDSLLGFVTGMGMLDLLGGRECLSC